MVPTNKGRREVAARLRETMLTEGAAVIEESEGLEPAVAARFVAIPNLAAALNFDKGIVSMRELTDRLADLIEPEPERTCMLTDKRWDDGTCVWGVECSECGSRFAYETGGMLEILPELRSESNR